MYYSALEHLLCLAAQSSRESSRPGKWTIEQGTVLKGFRNKSHFIKRRELYRMLPICEKALWSHIVV